MFFCWKFSRCNPWIFHKYWPHISLSANLKRWPPVHWKPWRYNQHIFFSLNNYALSGNGPGEYNAFYLRASPSQIKLPPVQQAMGRWLEILRAVLKLIRISGLRQRILDRRILQQQLVLNAREFFAIFKKSNIAALSLSWNGWYTVDCFSRVFAISGR